MVSSSHNSLWANRLQPGEGDALSSIQSLLLCVSVMLTWNRFWSVLRPINRKVEQGMNSPFPCFLVQNAIFPIFVGLHFFYNRFSFKCNSICFSLSRHKCATFEPNMKWHFAVPTFVHYSQLTHTIHWCCCVTINTLSCHSMTVTMQLYMNTNT